MFCSSQDEFKTIVVEAIQSVCVKFPRKHHVLMNFLSTMLREDGSFEYKKAIVSTIIIIIEENPDAKDAGECYRGFSRAFLTTLPTPLLPPSLLPGLSHLCEFIEDCEHVVLATRILYLLGKEGPRSQKPHQFIRFIYNRVLLEAPEVRAGEPRLSSSLSSCC